MTDHLNPAPEEEVAGSDGLSHYGDPEVEVIEEAEVEVLEEENPSDGRGDGPRVLRAPRAPTQKEIDAHMATHLPHAAWCDICMKGRGRNSPHRRNPQRWARHRDASSASDEGEPKCGDTEGHSTATGERPNGQLHDGPVPRVSMDYFYLSNQEMSLRKGAQAMSTKELQNKLREMGKSIKGQRSVLVRRYEQAAAQEEIDGPEAEEESKEKSGCAEGEKGQKPHATEHPVMVMVDEATGNKYMRMVDHKGLEGDGDSSWLVKDMHQELKSWGHPGGARNALILKSDGEPAIVAVREALARCHGGRVTPEQPPVGEHQANGAAEEAGKNVRDHARVLKIDLQSKIKRKIRFDEPIMPWLIRWASMAVSRFQPGKDKKAAYERQTGRTCQVEVVPFGETVLYRKPEVARDRHQALEERWDKGVWLGHARSTNAVLIATDDGVIKAWGVRRLAEGQQWDGDRILRIKGSPRNWKLDSSEDRQLEELPDGGIPDGVEDVEVPTGSRAGERRSMYLRQADFERFGFTDGCPGCMDIASGRPGPSSNWAAHRRSCRTRMELAIQDADPVRWERHLRRRKDPREEDVPERAPAAEVPPPQAEADAGDDDAVYSDGEPDREGLEDLFGYGGPHGPGSASALTEGRPGKEDRLTGTATGPVGRKSKPSPLIQRLCSVDVCEVFSPPRVGKEAVKFGMKPGDAMDLTTGWDFNIAEHRRSAEEYVDKERPLVLIGSPPCVAFSQLQTLIPDSDRKAEQLAEGTRHMEFMTRLYKKQVEGGRVFIHENPAHAKSWALPCIRKMMRQLGVDVVETDQCMFGLKTWGSTRSQLMLAKKPTRFMTNSRSIGTELRRKCDGSHVHQPLIDGRAKDAARYPPALCRAICRGIMKEKMQRQTGLRAVMEVGEGYHRRSIDTEEFHDKEESFIREQLERAEEEILSRYPEVNRLTGTATGPVGKEMDGKKAISLRRLTQHRNKAGAVTTALAWDDLTGMKLDAGKVVEARGKEVTYIRDKRVYDKVPRQQALRNKWKIIKTRWIDINKGDDENPVYRSRLVGKEFNDGQMDGLFAATPPLEALRFLVHEAATVRSDEELGSKVIMINDVARAFFEAPATRNICIEIPKEDLSEADVRHDKVGHLRMSLYGTRDAAMNWQEEVAKEMRKLGFERGRYNPCLYYHRQRNLRTFLHGDDFATVGTRNGVRWFKEALERRFEIKTQCVGPGAVDGGWKKVAGTATGSAPTTTQGEDMKEGSEGRLLNRVLRCTPAGWEVEADQRHADLIVQELDLSNAHGVITPGEVEPRRKEGENEEELNPEETTRYRAITARANYLAADRPDIMYSVKELCRGMAKPTKAHWHKLKRLGRYMVENRRTVMKYDWQGHEQEVTGYSDSDWAGCRVTGRSTSGGALMIGGHFLKGWSRTQNNVTCSSAEAELIALVKCSAELLGMRSAMKDWGVESSGVAYADSSAALAIANRKGAGKLRHINVSALWIQEKQDLHQLEMRKILGTENPADLMTKYLTRSVMDSHFGFLSQRRESGRAKSGLNIQGKNTTTTERVDNASGSTLSMLGADTATGSALATCVVDDWLKHAQPQQDWPEPWIGETHFEATDGIRRSVRHTSARRALTTPLNCTELKLPLGVKWTGVRCTVIRPITRAKARGSQPSAKLSTKARKQSGDQPVIFNHWQTGLSKPVSPHTGGGGGDF